MEPLLEGTFESGNFGPAKKEVQEVALAAMTGEDKPSSIDCNFQMKVMNGTFTFPGIVSPCGKFIYFWGMWNAAETLTWLDDEGLQKYAEDR